MAKVDSIYLEESTRSGKKWMVTIFYTDGRRKTVHFGAEGYDDYTMHKDPDRMSLYVSRHSSKEDWTKSGIETAGFWSRWILWSKPSLTAAIKFTKDKFGLPIKRSSAP